MPSIRWGHGYDYAGMDAIEAWNGPWTGDDATTVSHWHTPAVAGDYIPIVGNSDSHNDSQTVGLAQTVYRLETLSTAAVLAAITGGHAWIAESSAVDLTFTATLGEDVAECGDHLGAGPEALVLVTLHRVRACPARSRGSSARPGSSGSASPTTPARSRSRRRSRPARRRSSAPRSAGRRVTW